MPDQRGSITAPIDLVPFKDVCHRLGIHWNTGYRLRRQQRFPLEVVEVGYRYYCRRQDVDHYTHAKAS